MPNNLHTHIKTMADRCQENMKAIDKSDVLLPGELVSMWKEQVELEQTYQWLLRIDQVRNPPKILAPQNNGAQIHKIN